MLKQSPLPRIGLQDSHESKEELEVDDPHADAEDADYENDEETTNPSTEEHTAPAEEPKKSSPSKVVWQSAGHSTYVKVEKKT